MSGQECHICIVGGGVVGLAVAAAVAPSGVDVVLCERHDGWGRETSSRNSEVIHAGIYYPAGSRKAALCVRGRHLLYEFCQRHGVPHRRCGKIIVAPTPTEISEIEALKQRGEANGVEGLRLLSRTEVASMEPHVAAAAGLHSPQSGILSAHGLMDAYAKIAADAGALLVRGAEVIGLERPKNQWRVRYRDSGGEDALLCRAVVNAAGLGAQQIMRLAGLDPAAMGLSLHMCKGDYFAVNGPKRHLISRLVYPPPREHLLSLGIHTVVSLQGGFKLGPSAYYVDAIDYSVDATQRRAFWEGVRRYLPFLAEEDLSPDMAGIRPKLAGPGEEARDFHIAHEDKAGAAGFFNLCGIESPGLTASLAIGEMVAKMVREFLA